MERFIKKQPFVIKEFGWDGRETFSKIEIGMIAHMRRNLLQRKDGGRSLNNPIFRFAVSLWICVTGALIGRGEDHIVTPEDWVQERIRHAKPGDRFLLKPGRYKMDWKIEGLLGTRESPIMISGEVNGDLPRLEMTKGSLNLVNCGHLILSNLEVEGALVAANIASLSLDHCRIRRDSGWRFFKNVIHLKQVVRCNFRDSTIQSRGMHSYLMEAVDCGEISLEQLVLEGRFQFGISVDQSTPQPEKSPFSISLSRSIVRGGDFALSHHPSIEWTVCDCSLLHQKKGLFYWRNDHTDGEQQDRNIVLRNNLIVYTLNELTEIVQSGTPPEMRFNSDASLNNVWYCFDRPRQNPKNLSIQALQGTRYGVRPNPEYLEGEEFFDKREQDRISNAFEIYQKKEQVAFLLYLLGFFGLAILASGSCRIGRNKDFSNEWSDRFVLDQYPWLLRFPVIACAIGVFVVYSASRFAPFHLDGLNTLTLDQWTTRWSTANRSNSVVQIAALAIVGFLLTIQVCLYCRAKLAGRILIALICVILILLVDVLDFFIFGGFTAPSPVRLVSTSLGALLAVFLLPRVPARLKKLEFIRLGHLVGLKWVDIAGVVGIVMAICYSWYPLELQTNPRGLLEKLESDQVEILPFHRISSFWNTFIYLWHGSIVGVALCRFFRFSRHRVRLAIGWSVLMWLAVEGGKLFLQVKLLSLDHVLWSIAGSWVGIRLHRILDLTPNVLDIAISVSARRTLRWAMGVSWVILPLWIELGWYYFWYMTK